MAKTSKDKLFELLAASGWTQDPRAKKAKSHYGPELTGDRNVQLHDSVNGGQWRLTLQWTDSGSGWRYNEGNRLLKTHVSYVAPGTEFEVAHGGYDRTHYELIGTLRSTENDSWAREAEKAFWEALKWNGKDDTVGTYRQAVDLLIKDPDVAIWLAKETEHKMREERLESDRRAQAEREARAQPLAVTVDQDGWGPGTWKALAGKLESASQAVRRANGTDDLAKLVAEVHVALIRVTEALTDEASLETGAYVDELTGLVNA